MKKIITVIFLLIPSFYLLTSISWAAECKSSCPDGDLDKCISECNKLLDISRQATVPHEKRAEELEKIISDAETNLKILSGLIQRKKEQIETQEEKISNQQAEFEQKVRNYYQKTYLNPASQFLFSVFFSTSDVASALREASIQEMLINKDKQAITAMVLRVVELTKSKEGLEENQTVLTQRKKGLEEVLAPIKKLVLEAKSYQQQLNSTIGGLSIRKQALLAEKTGSFQTTVGEVPVADDPASRPDYNPGFSPAFAGFSFGAPHRKGMSQYGAYGRAKSGQNAEEILRWYYNVELKKDYSSGVNISVSGYGSYNIEEYVKRIYEVPNSWGDNGGYESLKAQAVAARSYALAYTGNGSKSICATESCQVFKPANKGGNWERAVNETRGWVLVSGGSPFSAWYAASSGGYNIPSGWDTKCGNQSCWTGDAYEKIAGSKWFYKAWYRPRYSSPSRSHPWLNKDEFIDIANAILLYKKDSGTIPHLSQTDKSNPDTWSRDKVREQLGGDAISNVDNISVTYSTGGYTGNVKLQTDKGEKNIDGGTFREIFNLRAPGEIWLASSLFNLEKK